MVFDMPSIHSVRLGPPPRFTSAPSSGGITPDYTQCQVTTTDYVEEEPYHEDVDRDFREMAAAAVRAANREATQGYGLHSTALQIKDQVKSKWFYTEVLGMEIVKETEAGEVTMIFLAFPNPVDPEDPDLEFGQRRGLVQLVHVAGSEYDSSFRVQHAAPGFCHLCTSVPDLDAAMRRMMGMGVEVVCEGSNEQGYAVICDPDGYNVQLLYCEIDPCKALRRQLHEVLSASSDSCRGQAGSLSLPPRGTSDLARSQSTTSETDPPGAPVDLSSFRGGTPNFDHPHWQVVAESVGPSDSSVTAPATSVKMKLTPSGNVHVEGASEVRAIHSKSSSGSSSGQDSQAVGSSSSGSRGRSESSAPTSLTQASSNGSQRSSTGSQQTSTTTVRVMQAAANGSSSNRKLSPAAPSRLRRANAPQAIDLDFLPKQCQQNDQSSTSSVSSKVGKMSDVTPTARPQAKADDGDPGIQSDPGPLNGSTTAHSPSQVSTNGNAVPLKTPTAVPRSKRPTSPLLKGLRSRWSGFGSNSSKHSQGG